MKNDFFYSIQKCCQSDETLNMGPKAKKEPQAKVESKDNKSDQPEHREWDPQLSPECLDALEKDLETYYFEKPAEPVVYSSRSTRRHSYVKQKNKSNQELRDEQEWKENRLQNTELQRRRVNLPIFKYREHILDLIRRNKVVIISGETGSGKTTQVPQYILEENIKAGKGKPTRILVTQPGRISAITVAQRVAKERGDELNDEKTSSVGFQVRHEKCLPRTRGSIIYCTIGIVEKLLRMDRYLAKFSHIIIDEVHQRSLNSDFLVTIMKDIIENRSDLKLILMSASMDEASFKNYFLGSPLIKIPGRTFPVKEYYLENVLAQVKFPVKQQANSPQSKDPLYIKLYKPEDIPKLTALENKDTNLKLVAALVKEIHTLKKDKSGAILVFLSGWNELEIVEDFLRKGDYKLPNDAKIHYLHSVIDLSDQKSIFDRPEKGVRKIILSTNIAETSVTIEDVVYVVDCGKMKLSSFNLTKNEKSLNPEWISKSNAKQRAGRAGRVRDGFCFHLFSKAKEESLDQFVKPEILRRSLEEIVILTKLLGIKETHTFLNTAITPPPKEVVDAGIKLLLDINAFKPGPFPRSPEELTPLGDLLGWLPIHPVLGKMIVLGAIFSCLEPVLDVACILDDHNLFLMGQTREDIDSVIYNFGENTMSDHLMWAKIMKEWRLCVKAGTDQEFIRKNFLNSKMLNSMRRNQYQIIEMLEKCNLIGDDELRNVNSNKTELVRAVIAASLYPNVAVREQRCENSFNCKLKTAANSKILIHRRSITFKANHFKDGWAVFFHRTSEGSRSYVIETTLINSVVPVLLFGGKLQVATGTMSIDNDFVFIDEVIGIEVQKNFSSVLQTARQKLDQYVEEKLENPWITNWNDPDDPEVMFMERIMELMTMDGTAYKMSKFLKKVFC